jgi:hypothetical protein
MRGHALARERKAVPISSVSRVQAIDQKCHPQVTPPMVFVDQPDTARMAVTFIDEGFRERPEKAFDVRLTHQEVERKLDSTGLHFRQTLRVASFGRFPDQGGAKDVRIARRGFFDLRTFVLAGLAIRVAMPSRCRWAFNV